MVICILTSGYQYRSTDSGLHIHNLLVSESLPKNLGFRFILSSHWSGLMLVHH